jgi:transcriptional regulator with XRE-family HTH domain
VGGCGIILSGGFMNKLKEKRIEKGLTQMELARLCGVSINTVIRWENDVTTPTAENRAKLDEALNILPFTDE